ncbi:MAG: molybdopterin molybdotransferase MoeA [Polyangiaceae bacterium]
MLSVDEARARILRSVSPLPIERVPLQSALGRVLAEDVRSTAPLPGFDYSAMDGFALAAEACDGEGPWELPVVGESRTGHPPPEWVKGTACRIFTGAAIPRGATAVLLQENVLDDSGQPVASARGLASIRFAHRPRVGEHMRLAGEDLPLGAVGMAKGTRVGPLQLGLLAALDRGSLRVSTRPRVLILNTGDELREPGSPATSPTSIPESNSVVLAALARSVGADVSVTPLARDDLEATRAALVSALEHCDLLVTVGGVSVGDHDLVKPALEAAGVTLDFWKVQMKPGKPLVYGRAGSTHVLGLPGNPMSAQITFMLFGLPLLRALQAQRDCLPRTLSLKLLEPLKQKPGRRGFYPAKWEAAGVVPLGNKASGNTLGLASADVLVVMPEEIEELPVGHLVEAIALS